MDRLRIYNIALAVFNIEPLTEDDLLNSDGHPEVKILDLQYDTALHMAMRERAWTFLERPLELGEDQGAECGFRHSYTLPSDLFRLTRADGMYRVVGTKLLTDGRPLAYGIMLTLPDSGVPEDFYELVAFALAYFASPKLSPGDTKFQIALADYRMILQRLIANDVENCINEDRKIANGDGYYL